MERRTHDVHGGALVRAHQRERRRTARRRPARPPPVIPFRHPPARFLRSPPAEKSTTLTTRVPLKAGAVTSLPAAQAARKAATPAASPAWITKVRRSIDAHPGKAGAPDGSLATCSDIGDAPASDVKDRGGPACRVLIFLMIAPGHPPRARSPERVRLNRSIRGWRGRTRRSRPGGTSSDAWGTELGVALVPLERGPLVRAREVERVDRALPADQDHLLVPVDLNAVLGRNRVVRISAHASSARVGPASSRRRCSWARRGRPARRGRRSRCREGTAAGRERARSRRSRGGSGRRASAWWCPRGIRRVEGLPTLRSPGWCRPERCRSRAAG